MLAYGEFNSTNYWGMLAETLPFLMRWVLEPAFLFMVSSALAERFRPRILGLAVYTLTFFLMAPTLNVMGAWGPAHVAAEIGGWAWPAFWLLLLVKTILLHWRGPAKGLGGSADREHDRNGFLVAKDNAEGRVCGGRDE